MLGLLHTRISYHLEVGERRHDNLFLHRVLRDPAETGAAVHLAHFNLEDGRAAFLGARVLDRDVALDGRRHQRQLYPPAAPELVLFPELLRQQHPPQPAVDLAVVGQLPDATQLDDRRHDRVDRRHVPVALERLHAVLGEVSQLGVVLHEHGSGKKAEGYNLGLFQPRLERGLMVEEVVERLRYAHDAWVLLVRVRGHDELPLQRRIGLSAAIVGSDEVVVGVRAARVLELHHEEHARGGQPDMPVQPLEKLLHFRETASEGVIHHGKLVVG
mmetsp:Transcript_24153/g.57405  ORF Transcript_24153/g.57405 Transcript_24153/m.57405 type:complete len:272 (-) Transcript_24153:1201-2016(-)